MKLLNSITQPLTISFVLLIRSPAGYCFVDFGDYTVTQKVMNKLNSLPIPGSNPVCIIHKKDLKF